MVDLAIPTLAIAMTFVTLLATNTDDPTVTLIPSHPRYTFKVAFMPGTHALAVGGHGDAPPVRVWEVSEPREIHACQGEPASIFSLCYSPDGSMLATGGSDKTVRVWSREGKLLTSLPQGELVSAVAFHPKGPWLIVGYRDNPTIRIVNTKTWALEREINSEAKPGPIRGISQLALPPDGNEMATGGRDGETRIWDFETGRQARSFKAMGQGLGYSPDGKLFFANSYFGPAVNFYEARTGEEVLKIDVKSYAGALFSADSAFLYLDDMTKHKIRVIRVPSGEQVAEYTNPLPGRTFGMAISSDGQFLAVCGEGNKDGSVRVLKLPSVEKGK